MSTDIYLRDPAGQALVQAPSPYGLGPTGFDPSRVDFGVPILPNSPEEWALETRAFGAANGCPPPAVYQQLIRDLWFAFVRREEWYAQGIAARSDEPVLAGSAVGKSPVGSADAPQDSPPDHRDDGEPE